ncbi:MAG: 1-acyl-sn-glycerol-3-phosphate acyltransferase [Lachnospiraceae bacterium]|nr:1-acyl-sn-glycerol-3-phosphate acyltransferase [Lachnospiraceae bacterium]
MTKEWENPFLKFLLRDEPEKTLSRFGIKFRQRIFPLIAYVGSRLYGLKLIIVEKQEIPKDRPVIFACTHGFKEDFLASLLTVGEDFYVLFGNRKQALRSIDGFCAFVTGMILVDRFDKKSRRASKNKMVYALKCGAKVAIFPEGTWNNSPNKIVLNLYPGILDVAKVTNAWIVPIATLKGGDGVYSSIGQAIDSELLEGAEGIQRLRDELATLKWKLMEYESKNNPVTIPHGDAGIAYWQQIINAEIEAVKFYDRIAEQQCIYRE